jgi:hypothetical protein
MVQSPGENRGVVAARCKKIHYLSTGVGPSVSPAGPSNPDGLASEAIQCGFNLALNGGLIVLDLEPSIFRSIVFYHKG